MSVSHSNDHDSDRVVDEDIFTRTSDIKPPTTREKLKRAFDLYVYAPVMVTWGDIRTMLGAVLIGGFALLGLVGPSLVDEPQSMEGPVMLPPQIFSAPWTWLSEPYLLGTGYLGRSLLDMLVLATPRMWKIVLAGAILSVVVGTMIGASAGYFGGRIDAVLMTVTDTVLTIPGLVLVIVLSSVYQLTNPYVIGLILGIDNWPGLARTIRSEVLSIREEDFTEASRLMGLSKLTILRKDVISGLMPYISVNFARSSRRVIFESVGLYFLGVLPFTSLNWGVMMNEAYNNMNLADPAEWHWIGVPMLTIVLFSLGFILFAQGLDRVFNVRLRARHAKSVESDDEPAAEPPS